MWHNHEKHEQTKYEGNVHAKHARSRALCRAALACCLLALTLAACRAPGTPEQASPSPSTATASPSATPSATPSVTPSPSATRTAVPSATPTETPTPTATASATASPTVTPTPDPYAGLTIAHLRARSYGGGVFEVVQRLGVGAEFARDLVRYQSDGLWIHGFMNTPTAAAAGEGPFPVAIVLHGYIDPAVYETLAYTTRYADALARAGYLVIHPNLRNYPPSDSGPNEFHVGMAIDVLNLIALVQGSARNTGGAGPLSVGDSERIGVMGHSMGGGITWRVITVSDAVDAAVLYGSMNADEAVNIAQRRIWRAERGQPAPTGEPAAPAAPDLQRISPSSFLSEISTPISIHHSDQDATVPPEWSAQAYADLTALGKDVEYYRYQNTPHTFRGEQDALFIERMVAFFDREVKAGR